MKELSIEEKAKAYDEAINTIRNLVKAGLIYEDAAIQVFPTLKESEDEKIRKIIIRALHGDVLDMEETTKAIAWLEKQGEHKPIFRAGDILKKKSTGDIVTISEIDLKNREYRLSNTGFISFKYEYLWELVEQKPAWSEEDEKILDGVITNYESGYLPSVEKRDEIIEKLKSLKERVQPKQEWSDIDKDILFHTIDNLKFLRNTISKDLKYSVNITDIEREITWLKSLRPQNWTKEDKERYVSCLQRLGTGNPKQPETINSKWFKEHVYPQSQWKPNDEEMKALADALSLANNCGEENAFDLRTLYEQLEKLREE